LNEFIERTEIKEISQEYWQEAKKRLTVKILQPSIY